MEIAIFGTGYVGLVTGACLASLGHQVLCADIDKSKINILQRGEVHFYEPQLKELVKENIEKHRLTFTSNLQEAVKFGEIIFNCVGTPSKKDGSANLDHIFSVAKTVSEFSDGYKVLINKSTVPPGTAKKCQDLIFENNNESKIEMASNPEFLKEGSAVYDFMNPDKIVIGSENKNTNDLIKQIYNFKNKNFHFVETDLKTAEMIKYANNSFLATKISFINEIANICDAIGADVKTISKAIGLDNRINPKFLNPGIGYGGSCFPKDIRALINCAKENGYNPILLKEINSLNERQKTIIIKKIKKRFGPDLNDKIFSIWGLSFKPKTSDIRESTSIIIINELINLGAKIKVYDPISMEKFKEKINHPIEYCETINETTKGSSGVILCTEWEEFKKVKFSNLYEMNKKIIFDGRNIYDPELIKKEGFEYYGVGRR